MFIMYSIDENIIGTLKKQNNFRTTIEISSIATLKVIVLLTFAIAKVVTLNLFVYFICNGFVHWFIASFLHCSPITRKR